MKEPQRFSLALIPYIVLFAFMTVGALWYLGDLRSHLGTQSVVTGPPHLGGPFTLTDQDGKPRSDMDFRGKFMLVFFGYTYCPDVCPTTLAVIASALDKMGARADRIAPLFISVDPKRDTPAKLKSYLASFSPRFVGLTGSPEAVASAAKAYRVYYKEHPEEDGSYSVDHSGIVYLMDPRGAFVTNYSLDVAPDMLAADLEKRLSDAR